MSKILIVDSGMKNLGGHNFSYTRAVEAALAEKGYTVDVLANARLPEDLSRSSGYQPTFAHGAYDFPPPKNIKRVLEHLYAQGTVYADELEQFFEGRLSEYAAVLSHTVGDFELIGWNRFLSRCRLDAQLMLLMRWTHGFRAMNPLKRRFHPYLRIKPHYLNSIHSKMRGRFTLLTDSELLTEDYRAVYNHEIVTMPIPLNKYFLADEDEYAASLADFKRRYNLEHEKGLCVGYMGDARGAKGFHLLPALVRDALEKTEDVRFLFQCPRAASGTDDGSLPTGVAELREIEKNAKGRLTLISERLSEEDYANMFRALDIVLIPYLLPNYTEATSGIFAEAVALGKPVIVTEKTWMAHELEKFGGGMEIKSDDPADLKEKVFRLISEYDTYSAKARDFSREWCAFHNSRTLAEMLVKEIG